SPLCSISMYVLFFGIGWLFAKYGEMGFSNVFPRALGLFLIIYFIDALVKSIVIIKDHFKLTLTLKQ
ncbi:MAG: hypothetical protein U9P63_02765, partial [Patescibacteria group bacterium]|nr:hypothetical protein [Patescibacteria group bacterium]